MMNKLRVAIVGCGRISVSYADAFRKLTDKMQLVYAIDKDITKAEQFASQFDCFDTRPIPLENIESIYDKDIDVIHICLPHDQHAPIAIRAMEHEINVLTEKPIALSIQDADSMIETSKRTGMKLGCIFQTRYNETVQDLKARYDNGEFGKVMTARSYLSWSRPNSYYEESDWKGTWEHEGGGTLIDQAIHSMDRVRYILGSDVAWIEGSIHNHMHPDREIEDAAEAAIGFKNGCIYNIYACNYYGFDSPINIEFCGEKGRFGLIQDMGYTWFGKEYKEYHEVNKTESVGKDYWGTTHVMQISDFYDSVLNNEPVKIDGEEGRKTLEMVKGIYMSALLHKRIYLPFEDHKITGEEIKKLFCNG